MIQFTYIAQMRENRERENIKWERGRIEMGERENIRGRGENILRWSFCVGTTIEEEGYTVRSSGKKKRGGTRGWGRGVVAGKGFLAFFLEHSRALRTTKNYVMVP